MTRLAVITYCFCLIASMFAALATASAQTPTATALGPSQATIVEPPPFDPICPESVLKRHDDGGYENGYAWQYDGVARPYYGAFAEGFSLDAGAGAVCGMCFGLTAAGVEGGLMDVYVWDASGGDPGNVLSVTPDVNPGPVAFWPGVSQHQIDIADCCVPADYFVGWWPTWVNTGNFWWVAADENGPGTGLPRTNIAPGMGYPTGWNHPSVVDGWTGCRDLAIGSYEISCEGTPVREGSWGRVKALYRR